MVLAKNAIFDIKKGACGKPPAEENDLFPRERHFWAKKRRLRQAASWRKMVLVIFCRKKGACGKPPSEGNFLFP